MVVQPVRDVKVSVRILTCCLLAPPAAAPKWADWGPNRRPRRCWPAALPLGHYLDFSDGPPCCLGSHLPLTKSPNCVNLSDCLLAGSGTDWLTVNLSSRCTAEGNRIWLSHESSTTGHAMNGGGGGHTPPFGVTVQSTPLLSAFVTMGNRFGNHFLYPSLLPSLPPSVMAPQVHPCPQCRPSRLPQSQLRPCLSVAGLIPS